MDNFEVKSINVSTNQDDGYKMIAIADQEENIENYIILQRALHFDEQDVELGMDSYYFEYNDQSCSGYGICKEVILSADQLKFVLLNGEEITVLLICRYNKQAFKEYLSDILGDIFIER